MANQKSSTSKKSTTAKKTTAKPTGAKKTTAQTGAKKAVKKTAAEKTTAKRTVARKAPSKRTPSNTTAPKKTTAKKTTAKKTTANKTTAKKTTANKTTAKKTTAARPTRSKQRSTNSDAIAILKADHQRVTDLFDKFEGLGDQAHKSRESTVAKIIEELSVHAGIEETVFYPAVRERFAAKDEFIVLEALEEHHLLKLTLNELESMTSEHERYSAKVTVLREVVDHHVEEEETELFKQVRDVFTKSELVDLGDELTAARPSAPTRPHPVAPDTPPGNIVANVMAAPLDAAAGLTTRAANAVRGVVS